MAKTSDVQDMDKIVSSIDNFWGSGAIGEIVQGDLTRKQRKAARFLGFEVRHRARIAGLEI